MVAADAILVLALAVFNESRSEAIPGQRAVAEVVLNRATSRCYPDNPRDVIFQKNQFSWSGDKRKRSPALAIKVDRKAWMTAQNIATKTYVRLILSEPFSIGGATHFYSGKQPEWAKGYKAKRIGSHYFLTIPCKGESYVR